jgi:lipopolysaccharide assembly outer membrane protein LptD (OstA)
MKTSLIVMCLTLLPLTAQDSFEMKHLTVGTRANGRPAIPAIRLAAKSLEQSGGIVYLKGSVEINLPLHILLADEAEYDQDSGEIQAHGNVHLKPANQDSRGAGQFGVK